jgi:hypothetical protein
MAADHAVVLRRHVIDIALEQTLAVMYDITRLSSDDRALHKAVFTLLFDHFLDTTNLTRFNQSNGTARRALVTNLRRKATRRVRLRSQDITSDAVLVAHCLDQMTKQTAAIT